MKYKTEVELIIDQLLERDVILVGVNDGGDEDEYHHLQRDRSVGEPSARDEAVDAILGVDCAWLDVRTEPKVDGEGVHLNKACIYIVLGNEPGIAMCDWSAVPGTRVWKAIEEVSSVVNDLMNDAAKLVKHTAKGTWTITPTMQVTLDRIEGLQQRRANDLPKSEQKYIREEIRSYAVELYTEITKQLG